MVFMKQYRATTINRLISVHDANYRYVTIILIALGMIACCFSFMQFDRMEISVWKLLVGVGKEVDRNLVWIFDRFFILCVIFVAVQIIECIVLAISRDIYAVIVGYSAFVLNIAISGFIAATAIKAVDLFRGFGHDAWLKPTPFVAWVLVYVLMLATDIIMFWWMMKQSRAKNIFEDKGRVIVDDIYK